MPMPIKFHSAAASPAATSQQQMMQSNMFEIMPNRLYYTWTQVDLSQYNANPNSGEHYFTVDNALQYCAFYLDFGPLNMGHLYRFICFLESKVRDPALANKKLVFYSSTAHDKRANAAYLVATYIMVTQQMDPEDAYRPLLGADPPFMPFRDAGSGPATYFITVLDCLKGLHKAMSLGLFSFDSFDLAEYEKHEKVDNGDFNWITSKFLAFASPSDNPPSTFSANQLAEYFATHGVVTVVRLNNKLYDKNAFTRRGIEHIEMHFPDGSCPSDEIMYRFLDLAESRNGALAVHCKAGLGRTGSLIAAYLMKHYKFSASEVISFLRIMRPGSVVGPQQNWLAAKQNELHSLLANGGRTASSRPMSTSSTISNYTTAAITDRPSTQVISYGPVPNQPRKVHDPKDPLSVASSVNRYQQSAHASPANNAYSTQFAQQQQQPEQPLSIVSTSLSSVMGKPTVAWGSGPSAPATGRAGFRNLVAGTSAGQYNNNSQAEKIAAARQQTQQQQLQQPAVTASGPAGSHPQQSSASSRRSGGRSGQRGN